MSIIHLAQVSKKFKHYPLNKQSLRHDALAMLSQIWNPESSYYALKDISFKVESGEVIGIIGRNGSGKTTLLRLLAKIIRPSSGTMRVEGSSMALIGLATGFLPNLTGRENIYMNAALHGVFPDEIEPQISEIIDFADIGDFIDAPVRVYSSGMNARLGFSIMLQLLRETIFIDEILAVGDPAFQKKCFARIQKLKQEGRTILIVAHDLTSIETLTERVLWLDSAKLLMDDKTSCVLSEYRRFLDLS
jgi:ABC-type polysaccharide/polyol phosphate transport system ATPase subunit